MAYIDKVKEEIGGLIMEWFAISMLVIFLTGLGIVAGTAIRNAYKD